MPEALMSVIIFAPGQFFNTFFDKLAGGKKLKNQIISGMLSSEIRQSWQKELQEFKQMREFYLLYD